MGDSYETEQLIAWAKCEPEVTAALMRTLWAIRDAPEVAIIGPHSRPCRHR